MMDNNKKIALLIDLQKAAKDTFIVEVLNKLDNGEFIASLWANTVQKEINSILGETKAELAASSELLETLNKITETPVIVLMKTLISRLDNPNLAPQVTPGVTVAPYVPPPGQRNEYLNPSRGNQLY